MESLIIRPFHPEDQERVSAIFIEWSRHIAPPNNTAAFDEYIQRVLEEEILRIPDYYQNTHPAVVSGSPIYPVRSLACPGSKA